MVSKISKADAHAVASVRLRLACQSFEAHWLQSYDCPNLKTTMITSRLLKITCILLG